MRCPYCGGNTEVTDKRDSEGETRRRRGCLKCKKRFTTYEKIESKHLRVIKKDGKREQFDAEKLKRGLIKACEKRPVSLEKIEQTVHEIENKLKSGNKKEINSKIIGEFVMKALKRLDGVAYIRFASVYREFKDLNDFKLAIKQV
ncbi:MAG: transcriptional regulator NrdR [archaeon]|nr:transcriptional regulator NrdR [archaeon]